MTEETERRVGPYQLARILGRGGTSTVYEATDSRDGRIVALKVVAIPLDENEEDTLARRLHRASRAIADLSHPNIVRVYETGEAPFGGALADAPNARYIAMERIEGITLRERLRREEGPLSLADAADILNQVALGLDAVHQAGVTHRDIKPSNILLGADGVVKLTDFGIARRANDTIITQDGVMIGSPHYISPEQTKNQQATAASDLWSLGVVLFEMVVGRVPFVGQNIPETLHKVVQGGLPEIPLSLPPAVREVLARALERDPARRFPSATSLAKVFRHAADQAVALPAPRQRVRYSTTKRASFVPLALAGIGGLALVAVGFLAAPRFANTAKESTSTVIDMEKRPARADAARPAVRPNSWPPGPRQAAKAAVVAAAPVKAAPVTASPVAVTPSPSPSAGNAVIVLAPPSPPPSVTVTEKTPEATVTVTSQTERRRDMPPPIAPATPPLEVSANLPPLDLEPLPKATPRATPAPVIPTPAPLPASATPQDNEKSGDEEGVEDVDPNTRLTGVWRGTHTGRSARLTLREPNRDTGEFRGTLIVEMPSGPVRIAVVGQAFDDGGVTIRETKVLEAPEERAWDVGVNTGVFDPDDLTLSGQGKDKKGRTYQWSFRR